MCLQDIKLKHSEQGETVISNSTTFPTVLKFSAKMNLNQTLLEYSDSECDCLKCTIDEFMANDDNFEMDPIFPKSI